MLEESSISPYLARDPSDGVVVRAVSDRSLQVAASTISLLKQSDVEAVDNYKNIMAQPRQNIPEELMKQLDGIKTDYINSQKNNLGPILQDPTIPFETKQKAVENIKTGNVGEVNHITELTSKALIADSPTSGASAESVRDLWASRIDEVNSQTVERQKIVNAAKGAQEGNTEKLADLFEQFAIPMMDGITGARIANKMGANPAAVAILPGTYQKQLSDHVRNMSASDRVEFAKRLAPIVVASSGIITNKNQINIDAWLQQVVDGQVSTTDEWVSNIFNVLDLTGAGLFLKGATKSVKTARASLGAAQEAKRAREVEYLNRGTPPMDTPLPEAPRGPAAPIPGVNGEAVAPTPNLNENLTSLERAEAEYAELLSESRGQLDKRQVANLLAEKKQLESTLKQPGLTTRELSEKGAAQKALDRRQNIEAQIQRIDEQIEGNAIAAKADQRLSQLETEIEVLKKNEATAPAALNPITEGIRRASLNSLTGFHNPAAPSSIFTIANPTSAKTAHAQIYFQAEDFAQGITGMSKNDSLVKPVLNQVDDGSGVVNKVVDNPEEMIKRILFSGAGLEVKNSFGGFAFTEAELATAMAAKKTDVYENVSGLTINDGMSSFKVSDDGLEFEFSGVYTTGDGGWLRAEDALSQAKSALRKQGVTDKDVEILSAKGGGEYHPVKLKDVQGVDGDYVVRIKLKERVASHDVNTWDKLNVKRNFFDYLETVGENTWGSINRHFLEAASALHKQITGSVSIADDKGARLSKHFAEIFSDNFSTPFMKLPAERRKAVESYIKEANIKEIKFDRNTLMANFSKSEVDVLEGWKDSWDIMWVYENYDLSKTLRSQNFMLYEHPNLRMVVKERTKAYANNLVYDPAIDAIRKLTDAEIDDLYKKGGNIAEGKGDVSIGTATTKNILVRNTGNEVARKINDYDKLLEYRDGYYQVNYKHPQFIEKTNKDGSVDVVQVVGSRAEAERIRSRLKAADPTVEFNVRGDDRQIKRDANSLYFDLQKTRGRIAQRHRGQLLNNSVNTRNMGEIDFIESPADSAVRAAQSLGGRLAMRDTMEVAKSRFLDQFKNVLLKDEYGQPKFPANRGEITKKGVATSKELADARNTWEYIRSIENGYINSMDVALKNALNGVADLAGFKGYDTLEKMSRAGSDVNITGLVKGTVFGAFLASNPLRMWLIQPTAAFRMTFYNPGGFVSGRIPALLAEVIPSRVMDSTPVSKGAREFNDWFQRTGVTQAITRGNLIRGTLLDASGRATTAGVVKDATLGNLRKIGYDSAEAFNLLIHGAAIYDRYKTRGLDVNNLRVMDEMHMELRSVTRNMNLAGDMPYNQNAAALLMTYMQVPHKFLLQPFDRQLAVSDRMKLVAADLTFFGLPLGLISQAIDEDLLPENEWMRAALEDGLTNFMVNGIASLATGERQGVDTSSLNPYGLDSFAKLAEQALFDGGIKGMITNTPAGRVFGLNSDSRIGFAMKTASLYFSSPFTDDSLADAVTIKDVGRAFAKISSGWTNFEKARAAYVMGMVRDKQGRITDDHATAFESVFIGLGMNTKDTTSFYEVARAGGKSFKGAEDAARDDAKRIASIINHVALDGRERELVTRLYTQILSDKSWAPKNIDFNKYMMSIQNSLEVPAKQKIIENIFNTVKLTNPSSTNGAFITNIGEDILDPKEKEYLQETFKQTIQNLDKWNKVAEEEVKQRKQ